MSRKEAVLVIGCNSIIGMALAEGIANRKSVSKILGVARSISLASTPDYEMLQVEKYSEVNIDEILLDNKIRAIVISFGVLDSSEDLIQSIDLNFNVNTFEYLTVLKKIISSPHLTDDIEIHVTSSLLADFSRNSALIYALSKQATERIILQKIMPFHKNIFTWKLSYVDTPLNSGRSRSPIKTSKGEIQKCAEKKSKPGMYYIPKYARIPALFLKSLPTLHRYIK
jgi:hypothetical protein